MAVPVIRIAEMRDWEKSTWATGQTEAEVIRRVGKAIAQYAMHLTQSGDAILILAGKGNNGADARSAREHLSGRRVEVLDVSDPTNDFSKLDSALARRPELIVDGLF